MIREVSAIAWALLVAVQALAAYPHDAVCKVSCPPYGGSGTLVGVSKEGRGLVLTAWHVVNGGNRSRLTCRFPAGGEVCRARIVGRDANYDVAALDIENPPNIPTPPIRFAKRDDGPYTCVGYPYNGQGRLRWVKGPYLGYAGGGESAWASSMLHTRTHVISGYSGGARFNRYGEYCGVVSGMTGSSANMDRTWGVGGEALMQFVRRFMEVNE